MGVLQAIWAFWLVLITSGALAFPSSSTSIAARQDPDMSTLAEELLNVIQASGEGGADFTTNIQAHEQEINNVAESNLAARDLKSALICKAASLVFGIDRIVLPQDKRYDAQKSAYWSQLCWLPAACFIPLSSTLEVALAVKLVSTLQVPFAVRSGGHNANCGSSSIGSDGVVLDLSGLNSMQLSRDKATVTVGAGGKWDPLYAYLEKNQRTVVGVRAQGVGIGGLVTGGGMSHFSNAWGMASDNVQDFEVVLGDSRVVHANARENVDLFKALKGGLSNFGIVTKMILETKTEYQVWYQTNLYAPADKEKVMRAAVKVEEAMEKNDRLGFFLTVSNTFFAAGLLHRGWVNEVPKEFADAFKGITPTQVVPAVNGTILSTLQPAGGIARREVGTSSIRTDAATYAALADVLTSIGTVPFPLVFTFQPFSPKAVAISTKKGGNVLGIQSTRQAWIGLGSEWTDASQNNLAISKCHELINKLNAVAKAKGNLLNFQFANDASYIQNPIASYGKANVDFMRTVSQKYDRGQVFQKLQQGGFLLSRLK